MRARDAMNPIDTYRDTFKQLVAQGKTPLEALNEFDRDKWNAAMCAEIDERGESTLLALGAMAEHEANDLKDMEQAIELWGAGWTSEVPECYKHNSKSFWRQCPVMSWYWRRPPRRAGKPGRRYLSTNQAYNAMKRETESA